IYLPILPLPPPHSTLFPYTTLFRSMLIRTSTGAQVESANAKPTPDHQAVLSQIRAAKLSDAGTDLPSAFDRARQALVDLEATTRSEEHTSELQSRFDLVCRLLLEKK